MVPTQPRRQRPRNRNSRRRRPYRPAAMFDVLYGFIPMTRWEEKIINSPFFQRLRWIKQLGFSNYIFSGAEHNRFAHAIGVMHSMQSMLQALHLAVPNEELHNPKITHPRAMLHKCCRIAALLHDIGTFPFSHAIEYAYIRHGNHRQKAEKGGTRKKQAKDLPNSHEHLGSFIIKNTDYEGGITRILNEANIDVNLVSKIIKGESDSLVANQLMHSDLDADRMDYLMRDAHYTGLKYGQFDREYLLASLDTFDAGRGQVGFGVREAAIHAIEDFLMSRFNWYSQVIKNPGGAKYDVISTHIAKHLLEQDLIYQFQDLLSMVENRGERFFWFNDVYFLHSCQEIKYRGLVRDKKVSEMIDMLLYRKPTKTLNHELFKHRIISSNEDDVERSKLIKRIETLIQEFQHTLDKFGDGSEWILSELPTKDVVFTAGLSSIVKKRSSEVLYRERDPVKIVSKDGSPSLLVERDNSVMRFLADYSNFVPNVYANDSAWKLLKNKKLVT